MAFDFLREPHKDAAGYLKGRAVIGRGTFAKLPPALRAKAATVMGVNSARAIDDVYETAAAVPEGTDWEEAKSQIIDTLRPHLSPETAVTLFRDPDEIDKAERMLNRRAENILRMNIGQAYSQAKTQTLDENRDIFPYREYLTMGDGRVRSSHAALNHLILPADHPFWSKHTPPWEFGCRCDIAGVSAEEAGEIARDEADRGIPREQRSVLDDEMQNQVAEGKLMRGNQFVDLRTQHEKTGDGYEWNPRSGQWSREDILASLPTAAARKAWAAWAQQEKLAGTGGTVWEWAGGR